jgi:hypothetical protein
MKIMAKCQFQNEKGTSCRANAQRGKILCVFHDPARTADVQKARQAGGVRRARMSAVLPPNSPDHPLGNTNDVATLLGDSINRLRRGELDPRIANAVGYLANVLLRALEQGPMEERLAHLEAILGKSGMAPEEFEFKGRQE